MTFQYKEVKNFHSSKHLMIETSIFSILSFLKSRSKKKAEIELLFYNAKERYFKHQNFRISLFRKIMRFFYKYKYNYLLSNYFEILI